MHQLTFFVPGTPVMQGSKRYLGNRGGKGIMLEDNKDKNDAWRSDVRAEAAKAIDELPAGYLDDMYGLPLVMTVSFYYLRPKLHFRTGRYKDQLKPDAPMYKTTAPDVDKLLRSVGDSLSGLVYKDDALIVDYRGVKYYGALPGARITIHPAEVE